MQHVATNVYLYWRKRKRIWEKNSKTASSTRTGLFVKFWGRIRRWYTDEYLLKKQKSSSIFTQYRKISLGITFFENQKTCFEENNIEEKRMEIHLPITRTVENFSMIKEIIEIILITMMVFKICKSSVHFHFILSIRKNSNWR